MSNHHSQGTNREDDLPEIQEGQELVEQLSEERLQQEIGQMSDAVRGGLFPIKLIIKIIVFIIRILVAIFRLLTNRKFGLKEIKREIRAIEDRLDNKVVPSIVTTGPVGRNVGVSSIVVKILNNTDMPQTVTVTVYDLTKCPKRADSQGTVTIQPCCEETFIFSAPVQYEVEVSGLVKGVYVWSAARLQPPVVGVAFSQYIAANTFRHKEFVQQVPCLPAPCSE